MQAVQKIVVTLAIVVIVGALLPASPFQSLINNLQLAIPLGYLNWFFPIGMCLNALTVWTIAIAAYYLIAWVLRQLDVIQ